jgi:nucleotide-binding universal stress UspA family protein
MASHPLVVGYDGLDPAKHALDFALKESKLRNAPVAVVVVAAEHFATVDPYEPGAINVELLAPPPPEGPVEIQPILAEARERLAAAGVEGTVEWALGDPVTEILRVAQRDDATAIVVGERHHSIFTRLLGADTTEALIRDATCEVIVAH